MIIMTSVLRIIRESYDIYIKSIYKRKIHQFQNVGVHSQVRNRIFNVQTKTTIFHTRAHVGQHENTNHVNRLVFIISTIYRLPYFRKINTVVRLEIPRMLARKLALAIRRTKRNPLHSFTRSTYRVIYRLLAARWITSFRNNFSDERNKRGESLLFCEFRSNLAFDSRFVLLRYRTTGSSTVVIQMARWCHQR